MLSSLPIRETLKEKYAGALKAHYDDPAFEVVSMLFRVLADKKVTTPGNYQSLVDRLFHLESSLMIQPSLMGSHDGHSAVKCNVKANEGQLYFLERSILFISKQPSFVAHSDISAVTFARSVLILPFPVDTTDE